MKAADRLGLPRREKARPGSDPNVTHFYPPAPVPGRGRRRDELMRSLFSGGCSSAVTHGFALMGVAEVELSQSGLDALSRTTNLFNVLMPPSAMCEPTVSTEVYRAHCVELLARVKGKLTTNTSAWRGSTFLNPPTKAELLMALSAESLKHPLDQEHSLIMEQCFEHVFPGKVGTMLKTHGNVKAHRATRPLQSFEREVLNGLMVKLKVPTRRLESR